MGPHSSDLISSLFKGSASHPSGNIALFPLEALGMTLPRHRAEGEENSLLLHQCLNPHCESCFLSLIKTACTRNNWFWAHGLGKISLRWLGQNTVVVVVVLVCGRSERSFTSAHTGNTKDWKPFRASRGLLLTDRLPPATCHHLKSPSSPKVELPSKTKHSTQDHKWMLSVQTTANTFSGCRVKRCSSAFGRWTDIRVKIQKAY